MTKITKEIPASSNYSQRKSSRPHTKSRVVLENDDLSTEEFIKEESTEGLYTSSFLDNSNKNSDESKENNICRKCKDNYEASQF